MRLCLRWSLRLQLQLHRENACFLRVKRQGRRGAKVWPMPLPHTVSWVYKVTHAHCKSQLHSAHLIVTQLDHSFIRLWPKYLPFTKSSWFQKCRLYRTATDPCRTHAALHSVVLNVDYIPIRASLLLYFTDKLYFQYDTYPIIPHLLGASSRSVSALLVCLAYYFKCHSLFSHAHASLWTGRLMPTRWIINKTAEGAAAEWIMWSPLQAKELPFYV